MEKRFHERLAKLRRERGLSYRNIGEALRVTAQSVEHWEKGKSNPRPTKWEPLSRFLGVNLNWLVWNTGPKERTLLAVRDTSDTVNVNQHDDTVAPFDTDKGRSVPLKELEDVTMARNLSELSNSTDDKVIIHTTHACGNSSFAFTLRDRSMESEFNLGDVVVVDPDIKIEPGDCVVVKLLDKNQTVFRQISYGENGEVILSPRNPHYEVIKYTADNWEQFGQIIGTWSEKIVANRRR